MNKLLKTKNALKIIAIGVEKPSNFTLLNRIIILQNTP